MNLFRPPSIAKILLNFVTGFASGAVGSAMFGVVILLSWSVVGDTLSANETILNEFGAQVNVGEPHPLFLHFVTLAVFLSSLAGSMTFIYLSTLINQRYQFRSTMLAQGFFGSLALLVFMLPVYLVLSSVGGTTGVAFAGLLHVIFGGLLSFFVLEITNITRHVMVHVYGFLLGLIFFVLAVSFLASNSLTVVAFASFPLLLAFFSSANTMIQAVYVWAYQSYGVDYLNCETRFGADYETQSKETK